MLDKPNFNLFRFLEKSEMPPTSDALADATDRFNEVETASYGLSMALIAEIGLETAISEVPASTENVVSIDEARDRRLNHLAAGAVDDAAHVEQTEQDYLNRLRQEIEREAA